MRPTYARFRDDVLLTAAEMHHTVPAYSVDLTLICEKLPYAVPHPWREQVIPDLEDAGLVDADTTLLVRRLRVTETGLGAVDEIRASQEPPTLSDRLTSERATKLINVWSLAFSGIAMLVSLGALWVAWLALERA